MRKEDKKGKNTDIALDKLSFASREAFNLLRTNVTFAFPDETGGKVICVSSACPHEGKSTTAVNLAYSLAEGGYKVLLVDADMRRPTVYTAFKLPMEPGLSNILTGQAEKLVHQEVIHKNLSVLTSGHMPTNPSELISSNKMRMLLEEFKSEYDYVIVDLPPVLAVSDAVAISKHVSGTIVVVRHGITKRREIAEVVRQFEYAGSKILGFVYNIAQRSSKPGYSYKYKGRYTKYRSHYAVAPVEAAAEAESADKAEK